MIIDAGVHDVVEEVPFSESLAALRRGVQAVPESTCVSVVGVAGDPSSGYLDLREFILNWQMLDAFSGVPNLTWVGWPQLHHLHDPTLGPLTSGATGYDRTSLGVEHLGQAIEADVDLCHRPSAIELSLFEDRDGDGRRDAGERGVAGIQLGTRPDLSALPAYEPFDVWISDRAGVYRASAPPGEYHVFVEPGSSPQPVTVGEGETVRVEVALPRCGIEGGGRG